MVPAVLLSAEGVGGRTKGDVMPRPKPDKRLKRKHQNAAKKQARELNAVLPPNVQAKAVKGRVYIYYRHRGAQVRLYSAYPSKEFNIELRDARARRFLLAKPSSANGAHNHKETTYPTSTTRDLVN